MKWSALLLLVSIAACAQGRPLHRRFVLRVGTSMGLEPLTPLTINTAAAMFHEIVYHPLGEAFDEITVEGDTIHLKARAHLAGSPSHALLASEIEHPDLVSTTPTEDGVVVRLRTADAARAVTLASTLLAIGPYAPGAYAPPRLDLVRRVPLVGTPDVIELVDATPDVSWHQFLSRQVDILPFLGDDQRKHLDGIPSIRILDADERDVGLVFSSAGVPDVALRRAIALAIRRDALARDVVGDARRAVGPATDRDAARALLAGLGIDREHPRTLHLIVLDSSLGFARAALLLQAQLSEVGIELALQPLSTAEAADRTARGDSFELFLFYAGYEERYWRRYQSGSVGNMGRFHDDALDAAIAAHDAARVHALIDELVPVTPLYRAEQNVAVDASLCGVRHPSALVTYLGDIHPCAPGEAP